MFMWNNQCCVKWQISYSRCLIIAALHTICTGNEYNQRIRFVSLHHAAVGLFKSISSLTEPYLTIVCRCKVKTKRTRGGTGGVLFCKPLPDVETLVVVTSRVEAQEIDRERSDWKIPATEQHRRQATRYPRLAVHTSSSYIAVLMG